MRSVFNGEYMTWFKKTHASNPERRDPMQELTDLIIHHLELGIKPWVRPWDSTKCQGPQAPFNGATGAPYHGINVLALGMHPLAFQTGDPRFCSYLQAQEKSWQVRKGEKSCTVWFTKRYSVKDKDADEDDASKEVRVLKHYSVFHLSQMDGPPPYRPPPIEESPWQSDEATQIIMKNSGVKVNIGGDRAFFSPTFDFIQVPPSIAFINAAEEACVLLHELAHASGAESRLKRDLSGSFGSKTYAFEELIAETASAFLGLNLNLPADIPNHANYIGHWLGILKEDRRAIFLAAAQAQKAVDWILSLHPDYAARHQPERPITAEGQADAPTLTA
jgi:antirestriction protein ArdC